MIRNVGNTCYLGSALQCILRTPGFCHNNRYFFGEFKKSSRVHDPAELYRDIRAHYPYFGVNEQHDCHEAISVILDFLKSDAIFKLTLRNVITCEACGAHKSNEEVEYGLYEHYFTGTNHERLEGYTCETCDQSCCHRSHVITKYPPILIVKLPEDRLEGFVAQQSVTVEHEEYRLYAFCIHQPIGDGGHYAAVVRNQDGGWTRYDDDTCWDVELTEELFSKASVMFLHSCRFVV